MIGQKIINGRLVDLDKELIENLEEYVREIEEKEDNAKYDLDGIINYMINE